MAALLSRRQDDSRVEDVDFTKVDFAQRVNSDLIGKYINIASRAAGFIVKRFEGRILDAAMKDPLIERIKSRVPEVSAFYESVSSPAPPVW